MMLPAKSILGLFQPGAFYLSRTSHPLSSIFLGHLPPDRDIRGTMIEVADLYDRLADTLEKHRHHPKIH